jgi:hypothetical protein
MKPVWIKYYGMIPMTKRGYLMALAVAGGIVFPLLVVGILLGVLPPVSTLWHPDEGMAQRGFPGLLYKYFYWLILVCLVAQALDTTLTLRAFARKEAEQGALLEEESDS